MRVPPIAASIRIANQEGTASLFVQDGESMMKKQQEIMKQQKKFQEKYGDKMDKARKINSRNEKWYGSHGVSDRLMKKAKKLDEDSKSVGIWLWGWNTWTGILGLFFGFFIVVVAVATLIVRPAQEWSWCGAIAAAFFGFILFIMVLTWVFTAPGQNVSPVFTQGKLLGPLVAFFGSVAVLVGSGAEATFGILRFLEQRAAK